MRRVCRRASCRRARHRRNDAGSVSLHLGGGSPRCPAHRFVCVPFFTAARKSLCACFPAEAGRSLRAAVCEAVHGSNVSPPLEKRLTPALRCAQRYTEVEGEPLGCKVQKTVLRRRSIRSPCVYTCLPVLLFAAAPGAFARLLIGRGGVFALCRIRGGGRNPLGQRQALRFA